MHLPSSIHYTIVSVCLWLPLGVCVSFCVFVSASGCVSIYVGLSRRAQCDRELGAVLVKGRHFKASAFPLRDIRMLVVCTWTHRDTGFFLMLFIVWGCTQMSGQVWPEQWPGWGSPICQELTELSSRPPCPWGACPFAIYHLLSNLLDGRRRK